jgi:hypothetical protein
MVADTPLEEPGLLQNSKLEGGRNTPNINTNVEIIHKLCEIKKNKAIPITDLGGL